MNRAIRFSMGVDGFVSRAFAFISLVTLLLVGSTYYDMYRFTREGIDGVEYRSFRELQKINPDVVAWLTLDGTAVDHPVVKGKDNFEYLDKDFYGKDYAGGTLFLDEQCPGDFFEKYQLIHGHHMSGGAMFGDLKKYLQKGFLQKNHTGQLLTPTAQYNLELLGAGVYDAYDGNIYQIDGSLSRPLQAYDDCRQKGKRSLEAGEKLLALSTCSGDMDDRRIVVFWAMRKR